MKLFVKFIFTWLGFNLLIIFLFGLFTLWKFLFVILWICIYKPCNISCAYCEGPGNSEDSNCLKCKESLNYYHLNAPESTNCVNSSQISSNYYLNKVLTVFEVDFNNIHTCNDAGVSSGGWVNQEFVNKFGLEDSIQGWGNYTEYWHIQAAGGGG